MEQLYTLLISCFVWSTLYFTLCLLNPKRSYEWNIRLVTTIHALTVSILGLYFVFIVGPWPFSHQAFANERSTDFQQFVVVISLSYFILDFSWCLYFRTEGSVMMLHHSMSITGLSVCFITARWGAEIVTTVFGAEFTNPLLQLRWFLRETNNYNTLLGDVVDVAFMVMFGVMRLGFGSYLLYCYYAEDTDFLGRLGGTLIYSIGWVFWLSILQYGIKKYRRKYGDLKNVKRENKNGYNSKHKNGYKVEQNGTVQQNGKVHTEQNGITEVNGNLSKMCVNGTMNGVHKRNVHGDDNLMNGAHNQSKGTVIQE